MNIITGYKGEPHITAQEDRDINIGIFGNSLTDVYVPKVGQMLEAEIVSANEIRIRDGVLVMQGCAASIDYGAYDSLTISNGSQGMLRIDVIAAQYERAVDTNIESVSLVVVEGTPAASDPSAPTLTGGNIASGDTFVQMPLYYVNINGVAIDSIDAQFKTTYSAYDTTDFIDSLVSEIKTGTASSITSGNRANLTINIGKTGYTPIALGSASVTGNNSALANLNSFTFSGSTATVTVQNSSSSTQSWAGRVLVLYKKS